MYHGLNSKRTKWYASKQFIKEKPNSKRTCDMQVCNWKKKNLAGTSPFNMLVIDCMNKLAHQLCLLWQVSKCCMKFPKNELTVYSNTCWAFLIMWDQMKTRLFHRTSPYSLSLSPFSRRTQQQTQQHRVLSLTLGWWCNSARHQSPNLL